MSRSLLLHSTLLSVASSGATVAVSAAVSPTVSASVVLSSVTPVTATVAGSGSPQTA